MTVELIYETHATSTDNESGIATGWLPGELSEAGRRQARELGERRRDGRVVAVYTSDLRRAVETARIAFEGSGLPVRADPRLRECDYGELNGAARSRGGGGTAAPDPGAVPGRGELPAGGRPDPRLPGRAGSGSGW